MWSPLKPVHVCVRIKQMFLFWGTEVFFWTPYSARGCSSNAKISPPLCNLLNTAPVLLSGFCSREHPPRASLPQLQQLWNRNSSNHEDYLGHPSCATTKLSKEGEEERSWYHVSLFSMKDRVMLLVGTNQSTPTLPPQFLFDVQRFTS